MKFRLSRFGAKLSARSGIVELMDDLGRAMAGGEGLLMMGGGNPAHLPEMQRVWRRRMGEILDAGDTFERMLGDYDPPNGNPAFIESLVACLNAEYGWDLRPRNVAVTNGGQTAFFMLLNMFAGTSPDGAQKKILLPLIPEYIGYANQGLGEDLFAACRPRLEFLDDHTFKYRVDFDNLRIDESIAAICVSRPTNPSGNVLTDEEVGKLAELARQHGIPLIVDNAYGAPFPGLIYRESRPRWDENIILTLSLSKLGLPGTRTGIVLAHEDMVSVLASVNSVMGLATGSVGQVLVQPLLADGELLRLSREVIRPFYEAKAQQAVGWLRESLPEDLDYAIHASEGAFFLWVWFKGLPVPARTLYERLKARGVLVIPGEYFFGLADDWDHQHECVRITYSQSDDTVREGVKILAEEIVKAYR